MFSSEQQQRRTYLTGSEGSSNFPLVTKKDGFESMVEPRPLDMSKIKVLPCEDLMNPTCFSSSLHHHLSQDERATFSTVKFPSFVKAGINQYQQQSLYDILQTSTEIFDEEDINVLEDIWKFEASSTSLNLEEDALEPLPIDHACSSSQVLEPATLEFNNSSSDVPRTSKYQGDEEQWGIFGQTTMFQPPIFVTNSIGTASRQTATPFTFHQPMIRQVSSDDSPESRSSSLRCSKDKWMMKYTQLRDYRQRMGHCCVPYNFIENLALARWVKRQRCQYKSMLESKKSTMTPARVEMLEAIGFVWDSQRASWYERLEELKEFRRANGHTNVPCIYNENPQLASWVKCQRRQCKLFKESKPSNMSEERESELNKIGFEWTLIKKELKK